MTTNNTALILAAHGSSKDEITNKPMFELAHRIQTSLHNSVVSPAFLDGKPDVRTIIDEIVQDEIVVIPFMASKGYYTDTIFPKLLASADKTVRFTEAIGTHPKLPQLISKRIKELWRKLDNNSDTTIVVVGHGTRKNKNSCRTTIDIVHQLRLLNPELSIQFAFIDQNPNVNLVARAIKTTSVIVIPFLIGLGPHTTQDIPAAFGLKRLDQPTDGFNFPFPYVEKILTEARESRTIAFDSPVGTYPELSDICISIVLDAVNSEATNSICMETV